MKKLLFLYILMCNAICITAQDMSPTKQINAIKRDESYISAEATDSTVSSAYEAAKVLLVLQIKDYMRVQGMKVDDILANEKAEKCERMEMPRGNKHRVFVYVSKADVTSDAAARYYEPDSSEKEPEANVSEANTVGSFATDLKNWQQTLIGNLLNSADMEDCLTFLNKMKIQNKVKRIGNNDDAPRNPQQAFFAIFSQDGTLKAILGKETNGSRMNYMSKQSDQLSHYSTDDQIWFTLSNF